MSDKLKKFVTDHKQEFDSSEPAGDLWKKIDAKVEVKDASKISSKWLSKFKYLAFGASLLIIAVYFIASNLNHSSDNELVMDRKDSANNSERYHEANQNRPELNVSQNNKAKRNDPSNAKTGSEQLPLNNSNSGQQGILYDKDSLLNASQNSLDPLSVEDEKAHITSTVEKKETNAIRKSKPVLYIPEDPEKMNTYTGTLYEGIYFCQVLHAFSLPGITRVDNGGKQDGHLDKVTVRAIGCGTLAKMANMKAVWIKGKTTKEIEIVIKKGFKNIVLVKSDGRKLNPRAISHYYQGLGAIGEFEGKFFNITYADKVELILFFKDAEEGDKIIIDGQIETILKDHL